MTTPSTAEYRNGSEVAVIGLAGRFPGARNLDEYWRNLRNGVESISFFTDQELLSSGIDPVLLKDPCYVKAKGILQDVELFDASFFGFTPREAETMDPQHRLFLECAWEALESAGYDPDRYQGLIGVYGGAGQNSYFLNNLYPDREVMESTGEFQTMIGNDKDFLTSRVSYKMNLKGPSVVVQTACSTSLVAVSQACQSLLGGECDIALAGASSVSVPQMGGYRYQEGGIHSPDGHCRAFDARAQGTVFSNAVGIVVLKRLEEAIADGDTIHAVIKAAAVNNDGSCKVGYTAPSVEGQAKVIRTAQIMADIEPETISYIETHGTGTALGDPIEIAALTQAFRERSRKNGFCAIGSVKTNIGHTDTAAGIAGLIKLVLMLKNRLIPPSLHFEKPNPGIDFSNSPFYVNTRLSEWHAKGAPRRGAVSSFGIGGTNAHIIVEEAPPCKDSGPSRSWQLLLLSAKTGTALDSATRDLREHLKQHPQANLADIAYTLQKERKVFSHRRMAVCRDLPDAVRALEDMSPEDVSSSALQSPGNREVVFLFSGQGAQYVDMGLELYRTEATFRKHVDECSEILRPHLSLDLREILYPGEKDREQAANRLTQTGITQPALFAVEYALAKLWMSWGVTPAAMLGHSIGEYVAACLAGVLTLKEALALVAARGGLMQGLPAGAMLAVPLSEKELQPFLGDKLSLAAINAPSLCVISGEMGAVEDLENELSRQKISCRSLHTSHAFHSGMMEPILEVFTETVTKIRLKSPQIPYLSNVTGTWITSDQATDPAYWARHLRQTVRAADCLRELLKEPARILLEVGPGNTFSVLAHQQPDRTEEHLVLSSMRHPRLSRSDSAVLLHALGRIWLAGARVDWPAFSAGETRRRVPLPTYPFERKRYWVNAGGRRAAVRSGLPASSCEHDPAPCPQAVVTEQPKEGACSRASREEVAQTIINIWRKSLGHDRVTVQDNFFELGGTSLLALRMISQTEKAFGKKLPLSIFKSPSVNQLVNFIVQEEETLQ